MNANRYIRHPELLLIIVLKLQGLVFTGFPSRIGKGCSLARRNSCRHCPFGGNADTSLSAWIRSGSTPDLLDSSFDEPVVELSVRAFASSVFSVCISSSTSCAFRLLATPEVLAVLVAA